MKDAVKRGLFRLLGKDPEAVVVNFLSGDGQKARAMAEESRRLMAGRRHFDVDFMEGSVWSIYRELRRRFRRYRIGMAPVLFTREPRYRAMRRAVFLLAPTKVLAYNERLERHHLKPSTWIASWLFLRGVPLDRIWLRPSWLFPWKKDRTVRPSAHRVIEGRPLSARRRAAVLSPYFPYPLSHGGAVRIYHLLREMARDYDVFLFAFAEPLRQEDIAPVMEHCSRAVLLPPARYREPRWSTLRPPEVCEYDSPAMRALIERFRREWAIELLQVEYTYLASYAGDILVEHDVTFDLFRQILDREPSVGAWWDWWRWRRFERSAVRRYRRVVVMSEKDRAMLGAPAAEVIGNGVDLDRFTPEPETPGRRLLFIGSFRHFPNVTAYRFFTEEVWPLLAGRFPGMTLTAVAGPDPMLYWSGPPPAEHKRIRRLEFVRDVRPLYVEANIVIVPTLVSAGTNLKVLEAMAMERALVTTPSGCAGLGLVHGESAWIADGAEAFAKGVAALAGDPDLRRRLASAARRIAEERFDWRALGLRQREMMRGLLGPPCGIRAGREDDLGRIAEIQKASPLASQWPPRHYLGYDLQVAEAAGRVAGFLVCRDTSPGEAEVLNVAVDPEFRRRGIATALLRAAGARHPGELFLEVRESNLPAQALYAKLGFTVCGRRPGYYENPPETAIVMRLVRGRS